jgi:hypothetical protein
MLKSKKEIENYEEKAKFLQENGWETWYNDDNWIKTEWLEQDKSVDRMGDSTDRIYAWLMKKQNQETPLENKEVFNALKIYESLKNLEL